MTICKNIARTTLILAVTAYSVALLPSRSAAVLVTVHDNGDSDTVGGGISDRNPGNFAQLADNFVFPAGVLNITTAEWEGAYLPDNVPLAADNFLLRVFEDNGGVPMTTPLAERLVGNVNRVDTGKNFGPTANDLDIYGYATNFAPITLTAGVTYWFSVLNGSDGDKAWVWDNSNPGGGGGAAVRTLDDTPWFATDSEMAFALYGDEDPEGIPSAVPEPATLIVAALGLAGLGVFSLRKKFRRA